MTTAMIVAWALRGLFLIGYVVLAILAIKRKKSANDGNVSGEVSDSFIDELLGYIVSEIKSAEASFKALTGKSGFLKFDRVLSHAKDFCRDAGVVIETKWLTERIEALVQLMNFEKISEAQFEVPKVPQSTEKTDFNFVNGR